MLIEVVNCTIDGKKHGEQIEVGEAQGKHLVAIGYAKEIESVDVVQDEVVDVVQDEVVDVVQDEVVAETTEKPKAKGKSKK